MENCYEKPSFTAATDNTYEVPQLQKTITSSDGKAVEHFCNWKMSVLFVCLGVFAVVASVSLVLAVWSVVRDRDTSLHSGVTSHVPDIMNSQLTALQDSQRVQQNQLDKLQDQLNSFMANLSLYSILQDSQTEQQIQLDKLNSFMVNLSLFNQLTFSQKEAIRQSVLGLTEDDPVSSCRAVPRHRESGYYWIHLANGSAARVYCDMTRSCGGVTGGWTRVAYLQFENGSDPCPQGFRERSDFGIRTCGINSTTAACPSILFGTYGISYSRVCGKVLGYQYDNTDAFAEFGRGPNLTIDSNYVDGVSLTHGSSPRQHIWTFAAAVDEFGGSNNVCPCSHPRHSEAQLIPGFIGQHYFCDSGIDGRFSRERLNADDPLWDGAGCGPDSTCCSFNNPPWFQRELPSSTTDDIEMRVCRDERREDVLIAHVEIYVI